MKSSAKAYNMVKLSHPRRKLLQTSARDTEDVPAEKGVCSASRVSDSADQDQEKPINLCTSQSRAPHMSRCEP